MRKVTQWVLGLSTLSLAVYDLIPAVRRGRGDTLSEVLRDTAHKYPIVAFGAGVLVGHWWWSSVEEKAEAKADEKLESQQNA